MSGPAFQWSDAGVRGALGLSGEGDPGREYRTVSTDTRSLRPGDLFVALEGDRFDGHDFVEAAVEAGCGGIVARRPVEAGVPVYHVSDTLKALGDLARHRRDCAAVPVVGITGSSGKTTVKDLLVGALSSTSAVHGTEANLNNRVGVPRTILSMPEGAAVLVLEMGTNEPGEIAELARVARPTVAVVTTVSETHVERLGNLQGVMSEKLDLVRSLEPGGAAVVGDEPPELARRARELRPGTAVAGWSQGADRGLRPADARSWPNGAWSFTWDGQPVALRMPGAHNVYNALLALATARLLGVPAAAAAAGVSAVESGPMRNEVRRLGDLTLLVDCYNANAAGVLAAVSTLKNMAARGRRVAVLGTMLELGERCRAIHSETLRRVLDAGVDRLVLTGAFAQAFACDAGGARGRVHLVDEVEDLADRLPELLAPGDAVLLKASRGVRLERAIPALESRFGEARV